jgi:hypothetical protein
MTSASKVINNKFILIRIQNSSKKNNKYQKVKYHKTKIKNTYIYNNLEHLTMRQKSQIKIYVKMIIKKIFQKILYNINPLKAIIQILLKLKDIVHNKN